MPMTLLDAFQIEKGEVVSLVGGGGKTSTMFAIGKEAVKAGLKVVLTTTTRIYAPDRDSGVSVVLEADSGKLLTGIKNCFKACPLVVAGAGLTPEHKIAGIDEKIVHSILLAGADMVVVEADGAARKPFKAPREGEPVLPGRSSLIIPVVGIDCLNKPLTREYIHRPEVVSLLMGVDLGEKVTPPLVAGVLLHPRGYRKNIPHCCRWVPFINKVESAEELKDARELALLLGRGGTERVVIGAARELVPVREVIVW